MNFQKWELFSGSPGIYVKYHEVSCRNVLDELQDCIYSLKIVPGESKKVSSFGGLWIKEYAANIRTLNANLSFKG